MIIFSRITYFTDKMSTENIFEIATRNAMVFLTNNPELAKFVQTYNGSYATPQNNDHINIINRISNGLVSDGHSGASFAICLHACQNKLNE